MTTKYTSDHEWIREDKDDCYTVGITDYAQEQLGDVVFVELPEVGRSVESKEAIAVVESVKAASDIFAPLSGEIIEANQSLEDAPEDLNADAEGAAWLFKIKVTDPEQKAAFAEMMDQQAYKDSVA